MGKNRVYVKPVIEQAHEMWGVFQMTRWEAFWDDLKRYGFWTALVNLTGLWRWEF